MCHTLSPSPPPSSLPAAASRSAAAAPLRRCCRPPTLRACAGPAAALPAPARATYAAPPLLTLRRVALPPLAGAGEDVKKNIWFNIFQILIQHLRNTSSTFSKFWLNIFKILVQHFSSKWALVDFINKLISHLLQDVQSPRFCPLCFSASSFLPEIVIHPTNRAG